MNIKYFMWPWQHQFQPLAAGYARRLLEPLDANLAPDVFLVGFLAGDSNDRHPICVSPDNCRFQPDVFSEVPDRAKKIAQADPTSKFRYSSPTPADLGETRAIEAGFQRAIEQILASREAESVFFASPPAFVEGYMVLAVLKVSRRHFDAHYRLTKHFFHCGLLPVPIGRSLIEATIQSYLEALKGKLCGAEPGRDIPLIKHSSTIYRDAADKLMRGPAWAGGEMMGVGELYEACNTISIQSYEGQEGAGRLVFAKPDHPSVKLVLKLRSPVLIRDYGAVRKLLQMSTEALCLFCDSCSAYGLGTIENYDGSSEDLFVVRFLGRFTWELSHAGNVMMYCREGTPRLAPPAPPLASIRETLERVFKGAELDRVVSLAEAIARQNHGTMLVITTLAATESQRLIKQATAIEPFPLTNELIPLVTSIDGAVLIDLDGTCHAIGVILDGLANEKCTSARGSRYNSGVRYAYQEGTNDRVVIVKSEDGMVDVLPKADR